MLQLGNLEAEVMNDVWAAAEPTAVRDVVERINLTRSQPLAYTTILTTMDKLFRKGWLTREKRGRQFVYLPTETRDECVGRLMTRMLDDSTDPKAALLHFVEGLEPTEWTALRSALRKIACTDG